MTRNIFEAARGDLLYIIKRIKGVKEPTLIDIKDSKVRRILKPNYTTAGHILNASYNTKLGRYLAQLFVKNENDYTPNQWITIVTLLNAMVEFILANMIKKGRFKFPPIWNWLKVIGFFRDWLKTFVGLFSDPDIEIPEKLMPYKTPKVKSNEYNNR